MPEELTVDGLRAALRDGAASAGDEEQSRFEAQARRYEAAVHRLIGGIHGIIERIPELDARLEDEVETFVSPAFPGHSLDIEDQRLRITRGQDFLLFDPTAKALLSALGQVEIVSSRPIPFLMERLLYLIPDRGDGRPARWGFRSIENLGAELVHFDQQALLRMLKAVFVD